ncbi:MAG: hypothetical protein Kow0069_04310 [Promethearchaeota archaeon]
MHERCELPREALQGRLERWARQPAAAVAFDAVSSRILRAIRFHRSPVVRRVFFKLVVGFWRRIFRWFNRMKVTGLHHLPRGGAIFYANHPGQLDPLVLLAALPADYPVPGCFIAWGNGYFMDLLEWAYGFVVSRAESRQLKVERMVRALLRHPFLAIWPEGHPTYHEGVERGFSSVVDVYATINARGDHVPFVPVLLRGTHVLRRETPIRPGPVEVHFFSPKFLPREELLPPELRGKTPRQVIDQLMSFLAKKAGQRSYAPNPRLEARWRRHGTRRNA